MKVLSCVMATSILSASTLFAQTLTWQGAASGLLSESANWKDQQGSAAAPQDGDTLVVSGTVTFEAEDFSLGSNGLTIDCSGTLTTKTKFSGAGTITKTGAGELKMIGASSYSGGTRVDKGQLSISSATALGSGTVTLNATDGIYPVLNSTPNGITFANPIVFTGAYGNQPMLTCGDSVKFSKDIISSDSDLYVCANWGYLQMLGNVSAPGHTVHYTVASYNTSAEAYASQIAGSVNASFEKSGATKFTLNGVSTGLDNSLTVNGGTLLLGKNASWEGTNVVIAGASTVLDASATVKPFSNGVEFRLSGGATLKTAAHGFLCARKILVDGAELAPGYYRAADLPTCISGGVDFLVGYASTVWKGGASGAWSEAANWDADIPTDGKLAVFTNAVTLTGETVDVLSDGVKVWNFKDVTSAVEFVGDGSFTKMGSGVWDVKAVCSYGGGTIINGGELKIEAGASQYPLGTGTITIDRTLTSQPRLNVRKGGAKFGNIVITGEYDGKTASVELNNDPVLGDISSTGDFRIENAWTDAGGTRLSGAIDALGHTLYLGGTWATSQCGFVLAGSCNASVCLDDLHSGSGSVTLSNSFRGTDPNATLTVITAPTLSFNASSEWKGSCVFQKVDGHVKLTGASNLDSGAVVNVTNGTKLDIKSGVTVKIAELWSGAVQLPPGSYRASNHGEIISGGGVLKVGTPGLLLLFR